MINPLIHPYAMEWGAYLNMGYLQMLTDPVTPMGYSLFRYLSHVSEKYVVYVNGFVFINVAGFMHNKLVRAFVLRGYIALS